MPEEQLAGRAGGEDQPGAGAQPDETEPLCALDGCDNLLPPPAVDASGRRKGGRPSAYCCKAHADAASRARKAAQTAAVTDPLADLREVVNALTPATQPLLERLAEMRERLQAAENGALARVTAAQEDAVAARADADASRRTAEQAERARDKALVTARDDRSARDEHRRQAQRAAAEAEESKRQAWSAVAEHERARGNAEAATSSANEAREAAVADLRAAQEQVADLRKAHGELGSELDGTRDKLQEATAERALLQERLDSTRARAAAADAAASSATQQARQDAEAARTEAATLRAELDRVRAELADERTTRLLAESGAENAHNNLGECRVELAEAHGRIDQLLTLPRFPPQTNDDAGPA